MIKNSFKSILLTLSIAMLPFLMNGQPSIAEGKTLFKNNCASCHAKNMKSKATGPALGGAVERWTADYPIEDLYSWVRNSQKLVSIGHPRAVQLYNEWNKSVMQPAEFLTDDNIASLFLYIDDVFINGGKKQVVNGESVAEVESETPAWLYYLLFGFLAILALILARITSNLNFIASEKEGGTYERKTLWQTLTSKSVVGFVLFALVLFGGYTTVNNAVNLGRQEGYAPKQPIEFSHETHAGLNKIDCQYCHDGARRSKHSVIPAANTCMNCHKAITVGSKHGTAEITKIFASIGFNPNNNLYIDNYEDLSTEEVEAIYTKWIGDNYLEEADLQELDKEGKRVVADQWNNIYTSLTNDQKTKVQGPIEWVRIHNLPDHVYFNHAQHVTVGKLECQQCHGAVEEMEVMQQHSPLSMGWCINCHRQTEVKFADNAYYNSYEKYHEELKSGDRDAVTVEDIGGLECQKCHY
ncbi:MAG: c-type cytochrome [Saprospiraceae bacterium]|nr:c-type cytochrome [Bacteroidia bacterium]NNE13880.1 c-type cytochrome [Saprospiraceae bacterium]NNL92710.1 c-type cytochrome [Saprospiraceae bacterium]